MPAVHGQLHSERQEGAAFITSNGEPLAELGAHDSRTLFLAVEVDDRRQVMGELALVAAGA